jgi:hypothetical protein
MSQFHAQCVCLDSGKSLFSISTILNANKDSAAKKELRLLLMENYQELRRWACTITNLRSRHQTVFVVERARICARCAAVQALPGLKFCRKCGDGVLSELQSAGYLQRLPRRTAARLPDQTENVYETKHGPAHG